MFLRSFSHTAFLPSHQHIFLIFLPMLASKGVKMIKYNLLTSIIFVVVCFGNYNSGFLVFFW